MARLMMVQTMSMWCRKSERSVRGWTDAMAMCARRYSVRRGRVCARCCRLRLRRLTVRSVCAVAVLISYIRVFIRVCVGVVYVCHGFAVGRGRRGAAALST